MAGRESWMRGAAAVAGGLVMLVASGCEGGDKEAETSAAKSAKSAAKEREQTAASKEEATPAKEAPDGPAGEAPASAPEVKRAVAVLYATDGHEVRGEVRFEQMDDAVKVTGKILNLKPGSKHGFHVHEFGDCSVDDGSGAGGHYNPGGHQHALPPDRPRHAGDMGNVEANDEGTASPEGTFQNFVLSGEGNPVLGRAVIVHADEDDGSQPTGNAGARVACGVIGIAG